MTWEGWVEIGFVVVVASGLVVTAGAWWFGAI